MACTEIMNAFDWAMQTVPGGEEFPVTAFLTRHSGVLSKTISDIKDLRMGRDICRYAVGPVSYVPPTPTKFSVVGHLAGELEQFSWNNGNPNDSEAMEPVSDRTIQVEIYPDGTVNYRDKLNHKVIGALPFTKVTTTCVGGVLLTGTTENEVVVLGLRRDPAIARPK